MRCSSCGQELEARQSHCPVCGSASAPDPPTLASQTLPGAVGLEAQPSDEEATPNDPHQGPLRPGQVFAGRYRIDELLGAGGMGAVYRAWDQKVATTVALKVIRPEVGTDPEIAAELDSRFRRELLLARQVTHKNVVRIHDLGEVEGIKYITMSYIDGEDLASLLDREGCLPVAEALRLVRGIASGLLAAHEAGVVHRDLKPANILIEKATGEPFIMDFGIARSAEAESSAARRLPRTGANAGDGSSTRAGTVLGTLQYMAPEQFLGHRVDQRADLYALGLIFYDLLLGRQRVSSASSPSAELRARSERAPTPPRAVDAGVPESLDHLISRCLEPDPDARLKDSAELVRELAALDDEGHPVPVSRPLTSKLVAVAAGLVVVLLVGTWWAARRRAPELPPEPVTVLVEDLVNRTGDVSFEGAVEQTLAIAMEGAGFISSYPRPNALKVAEQLKPGSRLDQAMSRLVSRREGIDLILSPTLERDGAAYSLSVRALDPGSEGEDLHQLAEARARAGDRDSVLQAAAKVAAELRGKLGDTTPASTRLAAAETFSAGSLEAMRAYARAQNLAARGRFDEALEAYSEAVQHDPEFGRAYAGMGVVYGNLRREEEAEASYQKALQQLDRMTERERYRTLGGYYLLVSHNYEKAIENYRRLLELYPADRAGYTNLSFAYLLVRDFKAAVSTGRQAVELEPKSIIKRMNYAMYAMYAGDFDTAMEQSRVILDDKPDFGYALLTLGRSAAASGRLDTAREAYRQLSRLEPSSGASLAALGQADLAMLVGDSKQAATILETAVRAAEASGNSFDEASKLVALAEARLALGDPGAALRAARRATELSDQESVLYPAARLLIAVERGGEAEDLADRLEAMLQSQTTAAAGLIRGEWALRQGRLAEAVSELRSAWQSYDSWFCHFLMGRAYFEAGHLPEAIDELQECVERKGEITDVFIVDGATLRYFPPALYWLGRAHEALGNSDAAAARYREYLELKASALPPDPLARDAQARLGSR